MLLEIAATSGTPIAFDEFEVTGAEHGARAVLAALGEGDLGNAQRTAESLLIDDGLSGRELLLELRKAARRGENDPSLAIALAETDAESRRRSIRVHPGRRPARAPGGGVQVTEKVQRHYDEMAEVYDRRYDQGAGRSYHEHISEQVMARLPPGGRLLDIGCGTGLFVERYCERGGRAVGLDLSPKMIERARDRCRAAEWTVGTGDALPFRDDVFDAASSLLAFSYLPSSRPDARRGPAGAPARRAARPLHARP